MTLHERLVATVACGLLALVAAGCGALEEIDKANAKLPAKGKSAEAPAAGTAQAEGGNPLVERSKEWWDQAKSLSPAESTNSSIVRCRLSGGSQFMDRDDCRARGGVVSG